MPLCVARRSERLANQRGIQESWAMLASMRGTVDEAGLGGDDQQRPLGEQRGQHERVPHANLPQPDVP